MATPEQALATMIANLADKTGRTLAEWTALAAGSGQDKHGQLVRWLKSEHGLTHGYANLIAHETLRGAAVTAGGEDVLVDQLYAGKKAALRPIHDAVLAIVRKLGRDVELLPKKAYVSLRRNKQFAIVQPSTATRVDLGLALKGVEPHGRLEPSGSFSAMVSHRVRLGAEQDVDAEVKRWLQQAYERA
ncbi:MAG: DUF4287 domain-containing protein [Planctomycetota bacterium]